jgi:integrase
MDLRSGPLKLRRFDVPPLHLFAESRRHLRKHRPPLVNALARTYAAPIEGTPFAYPLLATFLLTGARETEVYGLELDDVSLERNTVTYRENHGRRLKTRGSQRIVPLWPRLEAILRDYLRGPHRPSGELLFPSPATGREGDSHRHPEADRSRGHPRGGLGIRRHAGGGAGEGQGGPAKEAWHGADQGAPALVLCGKAADT